MSAKRSTGQSWTRRELVGAGAAAAAISMLPLAAAVSAAQPARAETRRRQQGDWSIDDVWTGHPRYAEPIGYAKAQQPDPADPLEHL